MAEKKKEEEKEEINIFASGVVPKHELLTQEQRREFLQKLNISLKQLPRVRSGDPVIKILGGRRGDVVKITRKSAVAGEYNYYRVVI